MVRGCARPAGPGALPPVDDNQRIVQKEQTGIRKILVPALVGGVLLIIIGTIGILAVDDNATEKVFFGMLYIGLAVVGLGILAGAIC